MTETIYVIDPPVSPNDMDDLAKFLRDRGYGISITGRSLITFAGIHSQLIEHGPTYFLDVMPSNEALLPIMDHFDSAVATIMEYVNRLSASRILTIVDPYIFPKKYSEDYVRLFITIFQNLIETCKEICFVTAPDHNLEVRAHIEQAIGEINPNLKCSTITTDEIHDRFWIADEEEGLYVGTSLNGIGRKYTLIDYIRPDDIADIVATLRSFDP